MSSVSSYEDDNELNASDQIAIHKKTNKDEIVNKSKTECNIDNSAALDLTLNNKQSSEPIDLIYSSTLPSPSQSQPSSSNSPNSSAITSSSSSNDSHFSHHHHQHHSNIHHNNGLLQSLKCTQ